VLGNGKDGDEDENEHPDTRCQSPAIRPPERKEAFSKRQMINAFLMEHPRRQRRKSEHFPAARLSGKREWRSFSGWADD